jgi:hypothetical protein
MFRIGLGLRRFLIFGEDLVVGNLGFNVLGLMLLAYNTLFI